MVDFVNHRPNNSIDHPCSEGTVTMTDSSTPLKVFETLHQLLHLFRREIRQNLEQSDSDLTFGELRVLAFIGRTLNAPPRHWWNSVALTRRKSPALSVNCIKKG